MTTRTASEAQLSDTREEDRNVRPKTAHEELEYIAENSQMTDADANLDALHYVTIPTPSPLDIHGLSKDTALENLNTAQRAMWIANPGPKVLAYKAYGGRIEGRDEVLKTRDIIKSALPLESNPTVAVPIPEVKHKKDNNFLCALITGIPQDKAEELISKRFISTPELTILFVPFDPAPTTFLTTLKGFIFMDESRQETEAIVLSIVEHTLFEGEDTTPTMDLKRLLANNRDNIPHPMNHSIIEAIRFLRASIRVKRFELVKKEDIGTGEEGHPAWNIFIAPPTRDYGALRDWIHKVRKLTFVTEANGAGSTKKIYLCGICHSEGHPAGMCEYAKQPKWKAPTPTQSPALDNILNSASAGNHTRSTPTRGTRGRGQPSRGRNAPRA